jgi:four helix bundle protein
VGSIEGRRQATLRRNLEQRFQRVPRGSRGSKGFRSDGVPEVLTRVPGSTSSVDRKVCDIDSIQTIHFLITTTAHSQIAEQNPRFGRGNRVASNASMAGWKDFREIVAWRYARDLKIRVDVFLERPNVRSKYKLYDQLHDAVRSAPRNIAEGFGKFGNKEFARYARIAKGSEIEVLNHLLDLRDQRFISEDELMLSEHAARKALKAVVGLIRHLESTPDPPRPPKRDDEPL